MIHPRRTVNIANQRWVDERTEAITFDDPLEPGEEAIVAAAEIEGIEPRFALRAIGTTTHKADIDGDGTLESPIEYRYEWRSDPAGEWVDLPSMTGTLPWGSLADPTQVVPGEAIGPMAGFRVVFFNRSYRFDEPVSVDGAALGAIIVGELTDAPEVDDGR